MLCVQLHIGIGLVLYKHISILSKLYVLIYDVFLVTVIPCGGIQMAEQEKWYHSVDKVQRNALIGAMGGWTLDAMDMLLYIMALTSIIQEFHIDTAAAGMLASVTLLSSAIGGTGFGIFADYFGRKKALVFSIGIYTLFTGLSGIAHSLSELVVYRTVLGLGMGGAWSAGSLLVSESWPPEHRGKAGGIMQGGWAIGYILAAGLSGLILPIWGWRALFFAGIVPSVLILIFTITSVSESELWLKNKETKKFYHEKNTSKEQFTFLQIFQPHLLYYTILSCVFVAFAQLAYWGLFTWLPGFLSTPIAHGGAGLDIVKTSGWVIAMQIGAFIGYSSFGIISDKIGRKKTFAIFMLIAGGIVPIYGNTRDPVMLFVLGPIVGLFGSGYFSGFGPFLSELFPTQVRGTAQGFVYNFGRGISALAPVIIGVLAKTYGIGASLLITTLFFICGTISVMFLPETKGKILDS